MFRPRLREEGKRKIDCRRDDAVYSVIWFGGSRRDLIFVSKLVRSDPGLGDDHQETMMVQDIFMRVF